MNTRTGELYESLDLALKAGVPKRDLVEVSGPAEAIQRLQRAARAQAKRVKRATARRRIANQQQQKASGRRNRK